MSGWKWHAILAERQGDTPHVLSEEGRDDLKYALDRAKVFYIKKTSQIARVGVDLTTGDFLMGIFRIKAFEDYDGEYKLVYHRRMRQESGPDATRQGKYLHRYLIGMETDNGDQRILHFDPNTLRSKIKDHR